jgi:hypothetical protein
MQGLRNHPEMAELIQSSIQQILFLTPMKLDYFKLGIFDPAFCKK